MKFRCERETLADALATAGRAATGRTGTLPVLSGLRLELVGDRLTVTGTDLDLTIQLEVAVGGDVDGGVVLPARLASDIVRSLPAGKVEVSVDDDDVQISGGRSQFSVRPLSLDDYPRLTTPASSAVTLDAAAFGEALRQVVRAASTDEARPILTGVLLTAENDGLRLVATDSYRLAVRDLPGVSVLGADQKVLVPGRALNELQRVLGLGGELVLRLGASSVATARVAGELHVALPADALEQRVRDTVQAWLQSEARRVFQERIERFADRIHPRYAGWSLSSARSQWGSCTHNGRVRLSWRLIHFSLPVIDYVVAHELAHLAELNHGPRFWNTVAQLLPGFETARDEIRRVDMAALPL